MVHRRELLRHLGMLGVLIASILPAHIALAGAPNDTRPVDSEASITLASGGTASSLDPQRQKNSGEPAYTNLLYDRLTIVTKDFSVQPMLAESWSFTEGGGVLEMKLRRDVKFHDGVPFNAAAVKATIERGKSLPDSSVAAVLAVITSVDVVNDYTVHFHLIAGQGVNLPTIFATNAGMMISPKAIADGAGGLALDPGLAGSGPYVVKSFTPNAQVEFERAKDPPWQKDAGRLQGITIRYIAQNPARMNGMQAGQLDVSQILGTDMTRGLQLAKSGAFSAIEVTLLNPQSLFLVVDRPALKDVRVRQAIATAIDRKGIVDAAYGGHCEVGSQPVPKSHWAYDPALADTFNYDPNKAKALLAAAGVTSPSFNIMFTPGQVHEQNANLIQGMLQKVGIKANLVPLPAADAVANLRSGKDDSLAFAIAGSADPGQLVDTVYLGGYNLARDDTRGELTELARKGLNPNQTNTQRADIYHQLFKKVTEHVQSIPLCFSNNVWAYKKKVIGIPEVDGFFAGTPDFRFLAVLK